jgi:outer membrane protein assembly factor BamA
MKKYMMNTSIAEVIISIACLLLCNPIHAQESKDTVSRTGIRLYKKPYPPRKGDLFIIAMPIVGYNPSNGFMYGAGASSSAFFGSPASTSISSALASFMYTTKKQLLVYIKSTLFTVGNNWVLNGDWRYMDTSQPTYGGGTGQASSKLASNGFEIGDNLFSAPINDAQMMSYKQIRFYETVSKRIKDNFYLGVGYHLDIFTDVNDQLADTTADPPVITSYYAYNVKYGFDQDRNAISGISFNVCYDSRDNQNCPYEGQYANVSFHINPEFLGSDKNSTILYTEYRKYLDLTKNHRNMLCFWGMGNFLISGAIPYMDLPALGEDQYNKSGRGYTVGRFRGQSLIYGEAEFRKHLAATKKNPDFLGMVVFFNAVTASNRDAEINLFDYVNIAGGVGIRIMASKNARTKLGIDFAWGNYGSSGFYLRMNETF